MDPSLGCLVCSSQFKAKKTPVISKSNFEIYLKRLFQYLLIPKSLAADLSVICTQEKFCTSCLKSAQEIIDLQAQVAALEMQIQYRVENMGKAVVAVTSELEENSVEGITELWSDVTQQLWLKFRFPVIQSFAKGLLPTPSVVMKQCPVPTISRRLQTNKLEAGHNKKKDSSLNLGSKQKASSDAVKTFYCPVCPYKLDAVSKIERHKAVRKVQCHYLSNHNPVRRKDVSIDSDGNECYLCQFCPFKASITPQRQGDAVCVQNAKYSALLANSRHHMRLHSEDTNIRNRGTSSAPANALEREKAPSSSPKRLTRRKFEDRSFKLLKTPDLIDGRYYFTCPYPNCEFCYSTGYTDTDRRASLYCKLRYGLQKFGDHYIRSHSSKQRSMSSDADMNDPYEAFLKVAEGSCLLQCPWSDECSFSLKVAEDKTDIGYTYSTFSRHYAVHVYNESYNPDQSAKLSKNIHIKERSVKRISSLAGLKLAKSKYRKKTLYKNNGKGLEKLNLKIGKKRKVSSVKKVEAGQFSLAGTVKV